nr:hypothetical protein [Tanacetum cinerariifolium]
MSWRQFILTLRLHTAEEIENTGFGLYWAESGRQISDKGDLSAYRKGFLLRGIFWEPEKVTVTDLFYLRWIDVGSVNVPYLLGRMLIEERLQGLTVIVRDLLVINMVELRLARVEEEVHEIRGTLGEQREVMDAMARDLSKFTVWEAGGISQLLDSAGATYVRYSETHVPYQRCRVRQRISDASTSTAQ